MTVELRIGGQRLAGFTRGSVSLSMESLANTFEVEYVTRGAADGERLIHKGDAADLYIDDDLIIGGWITETSETDQADSLTFVGTGSSRTIDIAECSAPILTFENATLLAIAQKLVKRLGRGDLKASIIGEPGAPFATFSVQRGETVADAIQRACVRRGFLAYTVGEVLVLARAGSTRTRTKLERGKNVLRSARTDTLQNRFSEYIFRGQVPGTDQQWGSKANQLAHAVNDQGVKRYRPLILSVDTHGAGDLKTRATLERNQRAGRSETITCTVAGHRTDEGYTWRPNILVPYANPVLGVDATLLVVSARMRFGASEDEDTELTLTRPEAFALGAYPAQDGGAWT